jgi:N-acetylmuramoyl-L-alanine amidase CwlA
MINITKCTSTANTTVKSNRSIKYIVIHYTAGTRSTAGSAKAIAQYFGRSSTGASADFIVDDATIVQFNPDPKNRYCWSVGGSKYSNPATSVGATYYNKCTNSNSISIEMCSSKTNTSSLLASDTDWYITDATTNNAVELTKYLMNLYNIPASNVIMHHHVTGKICPNPWCVNESRLSKWNAFKAKLTGTTVEKEEVKETKKFIFVKANILGKSCEITGFNENDENWVKITSILEALGYTTKWNNTKKRAIAVKDGKETFLDIRTYISVDSISFAPLRELCEFLGFTVTWSKEDGIIVK